MLLDLEQAKANLREIGPAAHSSVSGVRATSGALRVLEGNLANNLRASERFLANVLGMVPILKKAFPIVGAAWGSGAVLNYEDLVRIDVLQADGTAGGVEMALLGRAL